MMSFAPDNLNILIVDDTSANLKTLTAILSERGYQVRPCRNGEIALNAVQKKQPDLILLDIRMPGIDGYEVCHRLKEDQNTRDTPVIFISALDEAMDKVKAFELGGVDYITKPFQPEEVLARIKTHLSLRQMQARLEHQNTQLQQANAKLKELDRLKSQFLANMSHELRTPLNSIIGFTGIMLQGIAGELNDEQKKQLNMVYKSGKHLLGLINDILDISKIEAGKIEIIPSQFEVRELIRTVENIVSPMIEKKGLTFQVAISEDVPPTIYSDKNRIKQVLVNLLSNATKFTESGKISLTVNADFEMRPAELRGEEKESEFHIPQSAIQFSVADTGVGIKPEHLPDVFDEFRQIEGPLKGKTAGIGLGLAISKFA
jgi:signal transduction histidine kinase